MEKLLLKSLLVPVLESIYPKAGIRIENLDLTVVSGKDDEELFTFIRLLEPNIKHVTIVAPDKGRMEESLSDMFDDSGLSISVRLREYRQHLKKRGFDYKFRQPGGNIALQDVQKVVAD